MEWAEKYRPEHLADIVGNTSAIRQMADWARTWTSRSKPLLLYGKPGIGKTSSVYALARDMNWDVIELNASDQRTAAVIERIAGAGSTTASLTGSLRKLIVMDEADNLQGNADRGGARAIIECIKNARQPMILIANDLYGLAPELRLRCEPVQFRAIPARSIAPRLRFICAAEKVACSEAAVHEIAESAEGDVRSAVNMLYASAIGRTSLAGEQVHTSQKDERVSIFSLVTAVFGKATDEELMETARNVDDTPEDIVQWVEGSVHTLTDSDAVRRAYRSLARADEYIGYTYRRQVLHALAVRDRGDDSWRCRSILRERYPHPDSAPGTLAEDVHGKKTEGDPRLRTLPPGRYDAAPPGHPAREVPGHHHPSCRARSRNLHPGANAGHRRAQLLLKRPCPCTGDREVRGKSGARKGTGAEKDGQENDRRSGRGDQPCPAC